MKTWMEREIEKQVLNTANPIEYGAEEYWCAMKVLDDMGITRECDGQELSLVGRIRKATNSFIDNPPQNKSNG